MVNEAYTHTTKFQSTQPSQAVTLWKAWYYNDFRISIHTALAGCDVTHSWIFPGNSEFQSTQPSQAVTPVFYWFLICVKISIHTALAGCDLRYTV